MALFDHLRGLIFGRWYLNPTWAWYFIAPNGVRTTLSINGSAAGSLLYSLSYPLCMDWVTGEYFAYQDDGNLFKLTVSGTDIIATQVSTTGTAPGAGWAPAGGGIWSKLWYCHELGGIALIPAHNRNVYFVRTH